MAEVPLPSAVRWLGVGLLVGGIMFSAWVHLILGENFSAALSLRQNHELIDHGPYRYVQHPMYVSFFIIVLGMGLTTANVGIGLPPLLELLAIMIWRTPEEEAMLSDQFGDRYRQYSQKTGRFVPRW